MESFGSGEGAEQQEEGTKKKMRTNIDKEKIEREKQMLLKVQSIKAGKDDWELTPSAWTMTKAVRQRGDVLTYGWVMIML